MSHPVYPFPCADRFVFQRNCCRRVEGRILNAGCREDPARLKETFGDRVTNLDRSATAEGPETPDFGRPLPVDVVHDMLVTPWPFADNAFDLVVLGDVLEDLPPHTQGIVLVESSRVAPYLCITVPEDGPRRDPHHWTTIDRAELDRILRWSGWDVLQMEEVPYGFVPRGHFVFAVRTVGTARYWAEVAP
jgi:hypothetical protein